MVKHILALDPATRCGWAHSAGLSGVWDLSIKRDESGGMRIIRFVSKLQEVVDAFPIQLIVYEAARHAGKFGGGPLVVQAELQGQIKRLAEELGVEYKGYSPSEIKKHATGKGNANKEKMIEAARARWPDVVDDNHADALWLLNMAMKEYKVGRSH